MARAAEAIADEKSVADADIFGANYRAHSHHFFEAVCRENFAEVGKST